MDKLTIIQCRSERTTFKKYEFILYNMVILREKFIHDYGHNYNIIGGV